mmetsp:Transcript_51066/g.102567  ORF Transcript_51066/g.102567 Transcript_51066/m.102567 type:complete len:83 (+) Transcript_51066:26-274(+)
MLGVLSVSPSFCNIVFLRLPCAVYSVIGHKNLFSLLLSAPCGCTSTYLSLMFLLLLFPLQFQRCLLIDADALKKYRDCFLDY